MERPPMESTMKSRTMLLITTAMMFQCSLESRDLRGLSNAGIADVHESSMHSTAQSIAMEIQEASSDSVLLSSIVCTSPGTILAGGEKGSMTGLTNTNISSLVANGANCFAGMSGGLFRSTNSGASWGPVPFMGTSYVRALAFSGKTCLL